MMINKAIVNEFDELCDLLSVQKDSLTNNINNILNLEVCTLYTCHIQIDSNSVINFVKHV